MNDLTWLARNVHEWPESTGCPIYMNGPRRMSAHQFAGYAEVTKDQWLAERARLQNKPSWDDAPEWADALVQTECGIWFWGVGDQKPNDDGGWKSINPKEEDCGSGEVLGDWRDTLEKRPEQYGTDGWIEYTGILNDVIDYDEIKLLFEDGHIENVLIQYGTFDHSKDHGEIVKWKKVVADKKEYSTNINSGDTFSFFGPTEPKHINCRCVTTEVKQEWKQGELPPVGTVCEVRHNDEWVECEVIGHFKQPAGMCVAFVYGYDERFGIKGIDYYMPDAFRPLRTEEEKAVEEMLDSAGGVFQPDHERLLITAFKRLYRDGYRKP